MKQTPYVIHRHDVERHAQNIAKLVVRGWSSELRSADDSMIRELLLAFNACEEQRLRDGHIGTNAWNHLRWSVYAMSNNLRCWFPLYYGDYAVPKDNRLDPLVWYPRSWLNSK